MIRLGHLTSYLTCPRLCYYRMHFGDSSFSEFSAAREIYLSSRQGFDLEWAKKRAKALYSNYNEEIFDEVARKFVSPQFTWKSIDFDVAIKNDGIGIVVSIEELVEFENEATPLFLALNPPEEGVWLKELIKAGAAGIAGGFRRALFYYAYSGELREVEVTFSVKRRTLKLIERVKMVQKGFLPERREGEYCKHCSFKEECESKPETFASKFL